MDNKALHPSRLAVRTSDVGQAKDDLDHLRDRLIVEVTSRAVVEPSTDQLVLVCWPTGVDDSWVGEISSLEISKHSELHCS